MSNAVEVGRLIVRLMGDSKHYLQTLELANKETKKFTGEAAQQLAKVSSAAKASAGLATQVFNGMKYAAIGAGASIAAMAAAAAVYAVPSIGKQFVPALEAAKTLMGELRTWTDNAVKSVFDFIGASGAIKAVTETLAGAAQMLKDFNNRGKLPEVAGTEDVYKFVRAMERQADLLAIRNEAEREVEKLRKDQLAKGVILTQQQLDEALAAAQLVEQEKELIKLEERRKQIKAAISRFTGDLQEEVDLFGLEGRQRQIAEFANEMEAAGRKLNEQEKNRILLLDQQLTKLEQQKQAEKDRQEAIKQAEQERQKATDDINKFIAGMQRDVDFFGMEGRERSIADFMATMKESGHALNAEQQYQLQLLNDQLTVLDAIQQAEQDRLKAQEEQRRMQESMQEGWASQAMNLMEQYSSPLEQLKMEIQEVQKLADVGALTQAWADKIIQQKMQGFTAAQSETQTIKSAGAGVFAGSSDAMIAQRAGTRTGKDEVVEHVKELIDQTEIQIGTEQDILQAIRDFGQKFQVAGM